MDNVAIRAHIKLKKKKKKRQISQNSNAYLVLQSCCDTGALESLHATTYFKNMRTTKALISLPFAFSDQRLRCSIKSYHFKTLANLGGLRPTLTKFPRDESHLSSTPVSIDTAHVGSYKAHPIKAISAIVSESQQETHRRHTKVLTLQSADNSKLRRKNKVGDIVYNSVSIIIVLS